MLFCINLLAMSTAFSENRISGLYPYCFLIAHLQGYFKSISGLVVFFGETILLICTQVKQSTLLL